MRTQIIETYPPRTSGIPTMITNAIGIIGGLMVLYIAFQTLKAGFDAGWKDGWWLGIRISSTLVLVYVIVEHILIPSDGAAADIFKSHTKKGADRQSLSGGLYGLGLFAAFFAVLASEQLMTFQLGVILAGIIITIFASLQFISWAAEIKTRHRALVTLAVTITILTALVGATRAYVNDETLASTLISMALAALILLWLLQSKARTVAMKRQQFWLHPNTAMVATLAVATWFIWHTTGSIVGVFGWLILLVALGYIRRNYIGNMVQKGLDWRPEPNFWVS